MIAHRQNEYYRRHRNGLVVIKPTVDPTSLAEFLRQAGVMVKYADRATLAHGLEELLHLWDEGLLHVTIRRESL
jgi:hypothetical protein